MRDEDGKFLFGDKIKSLRKFVGLLQKELAAELGISEARVSEYESDTYVPNHETLFNISRVCCMHIGYFYDTLTPHEYYRVSQDLKYAYYLSVLPDEVRRYQRKMLRKAFSISEKDIKDASTVITSTKSYKPKNSKRKIVAYHEDYLNELRKNSLAHAESMNPSRSEN